ncbi:hypothetical protein PR202_gb08859 [Eleusine coracana subsp. coracana]|uniref:Uncharacterized protein n=1 Tax=Eleusine coracana subsp. coracana TaxID=191504 RepID=A0AAV5EDB1_ELECO|nr:hypothetical protein PR202_gb08859 [Eleusine coracana subsp. coracana]
MAHMASGSAGGTMERSATIGERRGERIGGGSGGGLLSESRRLSATATVAAAVEHHQGFSRRKVRRKREADELLKKGKPSFDSVRILAGLSTCFVIPSEEPSIKRS